MMQGTSAARKPYLAAQLRRYWPRAEEAVLHLGIPAAPADEPEPLPPRLAIVALPEWAGDLGVDGGLLVPRQFVIPGPEEIWHRVDWWAATYWYLNGVAERAHEQAHGPVHSYSFRLKGWDARLWERAWVNRIALFLRRWAARERQQEEEKLFGPLPTAEVVLTHDVDAVRKTFAIRCKQSVFLALRALSSLVRGQPVQAGARLGRAAGFFFGPGSYWNFDRVAEREHARGLRGHFNFYAGGGGWARAPSGLLFDPGYDVAEARLAAQIRDLHARGWTIGLHQSFNAWSDPAAMRLEKERLEESLGAAVTSCRQHWLRFGWERTWRAQQEAGILLDTTLGFNDRPGFRNGAALEFHPWDPEAGGPLRLAALPMVLMDSHLYDYAELSEDARLREMRRWIDETSVVGGQMCVIWHQHALADDYGWDAGFEAFVGMLAESRPA